MPDKLILDALEMTQKHFLKRRRLISARKGHPCVADVDWRNVTLHPISRK